MNNEEQTAEEIDKEHGTDTIDPDQNAFPVKMQLVGAVSLLAIVFAFSYIPGMIRGLQADDAENADRAAQADASSLRDLGSDATDPFAELNITAEAAYVWDVRGQRALFNKNADVQLPLASVTKLMTALVAFELLDGGSTVPITMGAILQEGESGLSVGETFTLRDLTDLTLITSSNDGAYALAAAAGGSLDAGADAQTFVEAMNIRAEEIGLSETYFKNPTGLDISLTEAGAYGSARDMAFLMEYIVTHYPEVLELTTESLTEVANGNGEQHLAQNTNQSVIEIPGIIGSKTGYTTLAGGNLVIAFNAGLNRPIIISILSSTLSGRFRDTLALTEAVQRYVDQE